MHSLDEVGQEADAVRAEIEQLYVRGTAASSAADRKKLAALAEEWDRIGANHVASRLLAALRAADAGSNEAPRALLSAHTSLAVFERVLSLEAAAEAWAAHIEALREGEGDEGDEGEGGEDSGEESAATPGKAAPAPAAGAPSIDDPKGLLALVEELARAVEDLVRTGIPSATESTRAKLDASFKEASRRKLLRLGASLRYVNEEVNRFLTNDPAFSIRRFSLMLHRSWLVARGVAKGLREKNDWLVASLLGSASRAAPPRPVQALEVVTLGVYKRTILNAHTFDFRLRVVGATDAELVGRSLTYSLVFARRTDASAKETTAEGNLELRQSQGFEPKVLCQGAIVKITGCAVITDDRDGGRVVLGPKSTVTAGAAYSNWDALFRFDPGAALARVLGQTPGPLELAVETMEEIVVTDAKLGAEPLRTIDGRRIFAIAGAGGLAFDAVIPDHPYGDDGEEMLSRLRAGLKSRKKPLLYGLAYYEYGRTMFLPLSIFIGGSGASEPEPEPAAAKKKGGAAKPAKNEKKTAPRKADSPDLITLSERTNNQRQLVRSLF